ncbi:tetratricopeptide repeat protein [Tenacibaculum sp. MEBiC06402]|uniref:tetratricopeptide repeat protein n=1 Tax=unclassified Tenacibaculum TaxID=2635139 RepID=UPI003B9BC1C0
MVDQFLLFENYLAGELSGEDLINFENSLQSNIEFKEDFEQYKEVHHSLENSFKSEKELESFEKNLKNISTQYFNKETNQRSFRWIYSAAASIAILLSVYLFYPSSEATYEEYIEYPTVNFVTRGSEQKNLIDAQNAFNDKNFDKAIELLSKALNEDPTNTELKLYQGFSFIEINRFQEAETVLKPISEGNTSYKYTAIWYLALSNLKQEKHSECKALLTQLPEEFTQFKKAQKLLQNLPK